MLIRVEVAICEIAAGENQLSVRDFGIGSSSTIASAPQDGLGTKLIAVLAQQIGTRGEGRDEDPGTEFRLNLSDHPLARLINVRR